MPSTPDRRPAGLGLAALFSVAIGAIVAQSTVVSLLQAAGAGAAVFVAALLIGAALMAANSATYCELALMMPQATGPGAYIEAGLGAMPAIFAVMAGYVVPGLFGPAAELLLVDAVLGRLLPGALPAWAWAGGLMAVLLALNLRGVDVFARVQTGLSLTMLCALAVTAAWAVGGPAAAPVAPSPARPLSAEVLAGTVALVLYTLIGTELVTPLTGTARHPARDLPRAMGLGLASVVGVSLALCLAALCRLGPDRLMASPLPHLDLAVAVFGPTVAPMFGTVALVATASLLNTGLAIVPRMLMQMARAGQACPAFGRVNRHGVPWIATLFVAALPLVGLACSGGDVTRIVPLLIAAAGAWLVSYMVAHGALLALRRHAAQAARPWRAPGAPWVQLAAVAGMGAVIVHAAPSPELRGPVAGALAAILGAVLLASALWVRRVMRRPLFQPTGVPPAEVLQTR